MAVE
jgi:uncharacterized protein (DUF1778 family)